MFYKITPGFGKVKPNLNGTDRVGEDQYESTSLWLKK